ncbi:hypothetical protein [Janthinobacterium psychrotolerans]|uniref:Uncharacterized protein n=1 Tax=Janthinobacterium psychrotolerans TaxID=1747903 RepID=A0A1A7C0N9_9BURK|nr:hypothetical protein [Janthinobacterium psychrotolerans]OBV38564.1 hypothetical protein ASR47_1006164 [Janthinobacterium psychrotolerans]
MKKRTKIIISGLAGIIIMPVWIYTFYLLFFDKSEGKSGEIGKSAITIQEGILSDVGPSNSHGIIFSMTEYSHLVIGDNELKELRIVDELRNSLSDAMRKRCTLYIYNSTIVGIKLSNGRTYCANYKLGGLWHFLGWLLVILGVPLIFALGLGILCLIGGYGLIKRGKIYSCASNVPDGVILTA